MSGPLEIQRSQNVNVAKMIDRTSKRLLNKHHDKKCRLKCQVETHLYMPV